MMEIIVTIITASWAVFGGLVGVDAMSDGSHKLRLFWGLRVPLD